MSERTTRWLAGLWLVWALAVLGHNLWLWTGGRFTPDTDVLAMLPRDERNPLAAEATRALADGAARRVVVLVGGADWAQARRAGDTFAAALNGQAAATLRYRVADDAQQVWLDFYAPYRRSVLSAAARTQLQEASASQLADQAQALLYQPVSGPRLGRWLDDPLNLFGQWLAERAGLSRVRVQDGRLMLRDAEAHYAVLMLELQGSAFAMASQQALLPHLARAEQAARAASGAGLQILKVGVPLFAAAAAEQAQHELHTIGMGSLVGIVLLTLLAFRSLRPRLLVTLSMAVGLLSAVSVCALLFERLHLITLVFGASLLGVAENYGSNYFCARLGLEPGQRWQMLARQAPVMCLAMLTTVIGYALLAFTPFPGLQQIAVFSAVGLLASFVTVLWWFPLLDGGRMEPTRFAQWLGAQRAAWPALHMDRRGALFGAVLLVLCGFGAARLTVNDDIRQLQNAPAALVQDQREFGRLMQTPGVAQFLVVQGRDEEELLQREEALTAALRGLQARGLLGGYQAVSDWLPSQARQRQDLSLQQQRLAGEDGVLALLGARLDQPLPASAEAPAPVLMPQAWLAAPVSEPLRHQWLGRMGEGMATAVLLRGAEAAASQTALRQLANGLKGVSWVDKVGEVSSLLGRYRLIMSGVLLLGYVLVWAALAWRFGRAAWRALVPTALASLLTVAALALLGQPLQLFHVLPLLILLGLGVDYGIFLLETPARAAIAPFLSVTLAAACTLLSFGLLALSGTPALRAFGLTLLIGVSLAWALTPLFLPPQDH